MVPYLPAGSIVTRDIQMIEPLVVVIKSDPLPATPTDPWASGTGFRAAQACGLQTAGWVFDQSGPSLPREASTKDLDVRSKNLAVRFAFVFGGQGCDGPDTSPIQDEDVYFEFSVDGGVQWIEIDRLTSQYSSVRTLSYNLDSFPAAQTAATRFRWRQAKYTSTAHASDVWALGAVDISGIPPSIPSIQFSYYLGCDALAADLLLEYSTNRGQSWSTCQVCNPISDSKCRTWRTDCRFILTSSSLSGWRRGQVVVGNSQSLRVRWSSLAGASGVKDVYVGITCPSLCGGYGTCTAQGCICDLGHHLGPNGSCVVDEALLASTSKSGFLLTFDDGQSDSTAVFALNTGDVVPELGRCRVLTSGSKLVFNSLGNRLLSTADFNTTGAAFMEYTIMLGNTADSSCPAPRSSTRGIVFAYSTDGGMSFSYLAGHSYNVQGPTTTAVTLPQAARTPETRFVWFQPGQSGSTSDVWALDDLYLGPAVQLPTSLWSTCRNLPLEPGFMFHANGLIGSCAADDNVLLFDMQASRPGWQYLSTAGTDLPEDSVLQFDLSMGCGETKATDFYVYGEYSDNNGASWSRLLGWCNPYSTSSCRTWNWLEGTAFRSRNYFGNWTRVTIPVQANVGRRYRLRADRSYATTTTMKWAIRNLYLGAGCGSSGCSGHGRCVDGKCQCDAGFIANGKQECVSTREATVFRETFSGGFSSSLWLEWSGMTLRNSDSGTSCWWNTDDQVLMSTGDTTVFSRAVTQDLNLVGSAYLEFWLRIGDSQGGSSCSFPSSVGVVLAYSVNGGVTWTYWQQFYYRSYGTPARQYLAIPSEAMTNNTRLMWWQPTQSGAWVSVQLCGCTCLSRQSVSILYGAE